MLVVRLCHEGSHRRCELCGGRFGTQQLVLGPASMQLPGLQAVVVRDAAAVVPQAPSLVQCGWQRVG